MQDHHFFWSHVLSDVLQRCSGVFLLDNLQYASSVKVAPYARALLDLLRKPFFEVARAQKNPSRLVHNMNSIPRDRCAGRSNCLERLLARKFSKNCFFTATVRLIWEVTTLSVSCVAIVKDFLYRQKAETNYGVGMLLKRIKGMNTLTCVYKADEFPLAGEPLIVTLREGQWEFCKSLVIYL